MDIEEMELALNALKEAIYAFSDAGEERLCARTKDLLTIALDRYEAEGGDRTMYDAATI